jgi:molybdenum cofactor cytidylyltransferase
MIGAIVLAAGSSSRMGRPKATLEAGPGGPNFVDAILETLGAAGISAARVVVAPGFEHAGPSFVVNPDPSAGMLSSIHRGLGALQGRLDAVLVWPVDHPLVKRETVDAMIAAFRAGSPPIVVPTYEGRRGHPVLFAARLIPELLAADPSKGARAVVHAHEDRLELAVDDPGVLSDIDTPEDYARQFKKKGTLPFFLSAGIGIAIASLAVACSAPAAKTEAERTVTDTARGVRYVVPEGWKSSDGEVRSRGGTLLTLRVYDLVEAKKTFVAGLPDSLIPQLKEWAEFYFKVDGPPTRTETQVAGLPATELTYPVRVRPKDPPTKVIYWVVIRKTRMFVLRAAFPAKMLADEEPVMRKLVDGWVFLE